MAQAAFFFFLTGFIGLPAHPESVEPGAAELMEKKKIVYRINPEKRGGEAFKLVYLVPVPVDVFWRFKTDFQGDFLLSNKYIKEHRLIENNRNVTITENSYTHVPSETFRWQTTVHDKDYRLEFKLKNPRECGQKFNYGTIRLETFGPYTKVTHIAYFDFFGASLWASLPFEGGMKSFLTYTARWEMDTIKRLKQHYTLQTAE
jgi:hypothetical protein